MVEKRIWFLCILLLADAKESWASPAKRSYTIGLQTLQVIDVQLLLKEATKSARFSSVGIFSFLRNRCRAIFTLSGEMPINSAISFMLRLRPMSEQSFRSLWLRSGY